MALLTKYRLSEQIMNLLAGGDPGSAVSISYNEIKISVGQVINKLLKIDYLSVNGKMLELIPNGSVLAQYEGIVPTSLGNGKSQATLPAKPQKLPRNMGVYSVWLNSQYDKEFIPLQMGQANLIKSQPLINNLLGQIGYEVFGDKIVFTKDLTLLFYGETVSMRLAIMDMDKYDDYDLLPLPPEFEWDVITEVYKMYSTQPIPDKLVDPTVAEQKGVQTNQQMQP